jgi:recombination protein RecA
MAKKKEKTNGISDAIKDINDRFGSGSIIKLDDKPATDLDAIPSGSFGVDMAIGIGGYPRGRIVEIFGMEASGKTTLALHAVAEAQKKDGSCAYIDAEHALDPAYAKRIGVKTKDLFISQPQSGEQGLEILERLLRSKEFSVIVVDSVATLTPQAEIEGEMGDQHIGRHARLMSQALRKLVCLIHESNTLVIFINQIRMMIAQPYGSPKFTPGGKALKFYSSIRMEVARIGNLKKGEEVVGGRIKVMVLKNKVAPPFKNTEFDLMYNEGISREGELLAMGEKFKLIEKKGAHYSYGDIKIGHGYENARLFLKKNKEIATKLFEAIKVELHKNNEEIELDA